MSIKERLLSAHLNCDSLSAPHSLNLEFWLGGQVSTLNQVGASPPCPHSPSGMEQRRPPAPPKTELTTRDSTTKLGERITKGGG